MLSNAKSNLTLSQTQATSSAFKNSREIVEDMTVPEQPWNDEMIEEKRGRKSSYHLER